MTKNLNNLKQINRLSKKTSPYRLYASQANQVDYLNLLSCYAY